MTQENKNFYKMVFTLVIPIVIQNLINTAVNSVDVFMLGYVGQTALSASSLANQLFNILSFIFYGVATGTSVLAAQYWGRKDCRTIEKVLGIALKVAWGFALIFFIPAFFLPKQVMMLYSSETEIIATGAVYLRIIAVTYLLSAFSQMYLSTQRCIERVRLSTLVLASSLIMNVVLNACFIFGIGPFPQLGLKGVAIATVIARLYEVIFCLIDSYRNKLVKFHIMDVIQNNKELLKDFFKYSLPAVLNDVVASVGWSMYSVIMGHLGSDIVAANSLAVVARNFGSVFCFGLVGGVMIVMGKTLGENKLDLAKEYGSKFLKLALFSGFIGCIIILALSPLITGLSNLTPAGTHYLKLMLFINAYYIFGLAMNSMWISGIFRSGGDTKFGLLCDTFCLWCFVIPVGFILAFLLHVPAIWVYVFLMLDEFFKIPFAYKHYKKYGWVQNITR